MKVHLIFTLQVVKQFIFISYVFLGLLFVSASPLIGQAPSSILPDIVDFKIQMPLDDNGDDYTGVAWEDRGNPPIASENITNLSGYIAPAPYDEYFYVDGGEVVFKAHCAGALTSINAYPRSELRERPGGTDDLWEFADEHELNATFRVTHLPDIKKEVCMLQIKGNTSNSTSNTDEALRLEYREGSQGLHLVKNESTTLNYIMDYNLGETIEARLYVNNGEVIVDLTNTSTGATYFHQYTSAYDWGYFKAGCYTQSSIWAQKNGIGNELPTAYGEVRFSSLILDSPLPVELIDFKGHFEERNNRIALAWQTSAEINNKGFYLERALNPNEGFEVIGWIKGKGNSDIFNEYSFIDNAIEMGESYYYRLQQIDFDGLSDFSKIIVIQTLGAEENWIVFPNPVQDNMTIVSKYLIQDIEGQLQLIDINGKVVFAQSNLFQKEKKIELSIGHLSSGVYSILINDRKGQILTTKTIIRK